MSLVTNFSGGGTPPALFPTPLHAVPFSVPGHLPWRAGTLGEVRWRGWSGPLRPSATYWLHHCGSFYVSFGNPWRYPWWDSVIGGNWGRVWKWKCQETPPPPKESKNSPKQPEPAKQSKVTLKISKTAKRPGMVGNLFFSQLGKDGLEERPNPPKRTLITTKTPEADHGQRTNLLKEILGNRHNRRNTRRLGGFDQQILPDWHGTDLTRELEADDKSHASVLEGEGFVGGWGGCEEVELLVQVDNQLVAQGLGWFLKHLQVVDADVCSKVVIFSLYSLTVHCFMAWCKFTKKRKTKPPTLNLELVLVKGIHPNDLVSWPVLLSQSQLFWIPLVDARFWKHNCKVPKGNALNGVPQATMLSICWDV